VDTIIGIVIGIAACLLAQRFSPATWDKLTRKADKIIDEKIEK
jgi:uncharacterized membrane protein YccC